MNGIKSHALEECHVIEIVSENVHCHFATPAKGKKNGRLLHTKCAYVHLTQKKNQKENLIYAHAYALLSKIQFNAPREMSLCRSLVVYFRCSSFSLYYRHLKKNEIFYTLKRRNHDVHEYK